MGWPEHGMIGLMTNGEWTNYTLQWAVGHCRNVGGSGQWVSCSTLLHCRG